MAKVARILVVDDNARCVDLMKLSLEAEGGVEVLTETQPGAVLDRIFADKPGLVILDVRMPDIDGFQILETLRARRMTTPVLMCSGYAEQKDVDRAYAAGCNGYVSKPESLQDYRSLARAILAYWRLCEAPSS